MLLKNYLNLILFSISVNSEIYENYSGKVVCNASSPTLHPKTVEELHTIVKDAIKVGKRVKIRGSGHSNNDVICTDGIPISMKKIDGVTVNKKEKTATVSAGLEFITALDKMAELGVTIQVVPTYGGITVGGAIAMGAGGSSLTEPNTPSDYLKAVTIIDGHGNLITIDDTDKDFEALRVSLGQLGVIVSATFKTVPKQKMRVKHSKVDDELLINTPEKIISMAKSHQTFQLWWFPMSKSMVVHEGDVVPFETPGNAVTHLIPNVASIISGGLLYSFEGFQAINSTALMHAVELISESRLHKSIIFQDPIFEQNGKFVNPAVGLGYKLQMNKCDECGWDPLLISEKRLIPDGILTAIDIGRFPAVIADFNNIFKKFPIAFPMFGIFIRFGKAAQGVFSYGHGTDIVIIEITYPMRQNFYETAPIQLQVIQSIIQLLIFKYKAKPHWSQNGQVFYNREIISERHDVARFRRAVDRFDPNGIFRNKFGNRILGIGEDQYEISPKVKHCALLDFCFCKKDSDCAPKQKCGSLIGYPVCTSPDIW